MSKELEEGNLLTLDFTKIAKIAKNIKEDRDNVIPVAVQHADTKEIILIAYTNKVAMEESFAKKSLVLWSTSRNELWEKGLTSGSTFDILEVRVNCEQNSLVYIVRPRKGEICHTKNSAGEYRNCYYRTVDMDTSTLTNTNP